MTGNHRLLALTTALALSVMGSRLMVAHASDAENAPNFGGEPTVVCGQTIYPGLNGPTVHQFTQPGRYRLPPKLQAKRRPSGIPVLLQFTATCQTGVTISFQPSKHLEIKAEARTSDHKIAAIAVVARRAGLVHITAVGPDHRRTVISVHVEPEPPPVCPTPNICKT